MAGERENADRNGDTNIDADHAAVGALCKFSCIVAVLGEDNRAVCKRIAVHERKTLFKVFDPLDAKHRAEDLLRADGHFLGNVVKDSRADKVAALKAGNGNIPAVKNKRCALLNAFVNPADNTLLVSGGNNGAEG